MDTKKLYESRYKYSDQVLFNAYHRNVLLAKVAHKYLCAGTKVLDLGCNDGVVASYFFDMGLDVFGFDISERALALARKRGLPKLKQGNVENKLPYEDEYFDVVFWGDNAEHLFDPLSSLKEINRITKTNGYLIITAPNMGWIINRLYYAFLGMPRRTEGHNNPPWQWEHIRFFNKRIVTIFLSEGGFDLLCFYGSDKRALFNVMSMFCPSMFASVFLAVAQKA